MIRNYYTVAEVGRVVGYPAWGLRRLEARGLLPAAKRDKLANNARVYTEDDVARIRATLAELEAENNVAVAG